MKNEKMLELLKNMELVKLEQALIENIRLEVEKSKGTKASDLSIIKRVANFEAKRNNNRWSCCHPFIYNGIDYKGFTQGHYCLASQNDFNYKEAEKPLNLNSFFDLDFYKNTKIEVDILSLKTYIKTNPKKDRKPFVVDYLNSNNEACKIGFNAQYLLDCLSFCDTNIIYITKPKSPAFFENKDKQKLGLCLPVSL